LAAPAESTELDIEPLESAGLAVKPVASVELAVAPVKSVWLIEELMSSTGPATYIGRINESAELAEKQRCGASTVSSGTSRASRVSSKTSGE
jgi:hypothetical protein